MTKRDIDNRLVAKTYCGRSLQAADFSGSDLRGADFTGADLRSASFRQARFGVAPRAAAVILGLAMFAGVAAGAAIGVALTSVRQKLSAESWDEVAEGGTLGIVLVVFVAVLFWRGFDVAIKATAVLYLAALAVNVVANLLWEEFEWHVVARATALVTFLVVAIAVGMLGRLVGGVFGAWSIALVALLGGLASGRFNGGVAGVLIAVSLVLISKRAERGDARDRTLRRLAHRMVGKWGTRFVDADLTRADFTGTDASRCSVRRATIDDVNWDTTRALPLDLPNHAIPPGRH